jgi:phosphoribosylamine--glycine ligase
MVIKADGLASGKGTVIARDGAEALAAVKEMMTDRRFGTAGAKVVMEEFLRGEEVSFLVFCDGARALPMVSAQDHKRAQDGDTGPNTGEWARYPPPRTSR